jgi:hypothetical protein
MQIIPSQARVLPAARLARKIEETNVRVSKKVKIDNKCWGHKKVFILPFMLTQSA